MEYIYRITNDLNNKIYIGVTNNPQQRWYEHRYVTPLCRSLIHEAIVKYGEEHFNFQIIEEYENRSTVLTREKELISLLNCQAPNGYNIHEGGGAPPIQNKVNIEQVKLIVEDLTNNVLTKEEIINKYNITKSILSNINLGKAWRDDKLTYPLRANEHELLVVRANKIKQLLKTTNKTQKEIGEEFNISRTEVCHINIGKSFYDEKEHYPLRKHRVVGQTGKKGKAVTQIDISSLESIRQFSSAAEASRQTGINSNSISKCCRGERQTAGGYKWCFSDK